MQDKYVASCEARFVDILSRLRMGLNELTKDAPGESVIKNGQLFVMLSGWATGYVLVQGHQAVESTISEGQPITTAEEMEEALTTLCKDLLAESNQPLYEFEVRVEAYKPTKDYGRLALTTVSLHLKVEEDGSLAKPSWEKNPVCIGSATKASYRGIF